MPLTGSTVLQASLSAPSATPVSWSLSNGRGDLPARGGGHRIEAGRRAPVAGFLNRDVAPGTGVHALRGPFVQAS